MTKKKLYVLPPNTQNKFSLPLCPVCHQDMEYTAYFDEELYSNNVVIEANPMNLNVNHEMYRCKPCDVAAILFDDELLFDGIDKTPTAVEWEVVEG